MIRTLYEVRTNHIIMRLVWVVIPILLIVSMIGIVGVQESFATVPRVWGYDPEIIISNLPKIGETAEVTAIFTSGGMTGNPYETKLGITKHFEIIDSPYEITENEVAYFIAQPFSDGEEIRKTNSIKVTIKAISEGEASIAAYIEDATTRIRLYIGSEQTMLLNDYYEMYPEYLIEKTKAKELEEEKQRNAGLIPEEAPDEYILKVPASFVDPTKDPQIYIERYNSEPDYKEWFDDNYSNYNSIYHAVGLSQNTITPPPRVQLESGVTSENIICKEERVLVIRTNGKVACVTERTAERTDWEIISIGLEDNLPNVLMDFNAQQNDPEFITLSEAKISLSNYGSENSDLISELGSGSYYWPKFNMIFPEQVKIGEPFDVVLDYTYVIPDEDTGNYADPEEICTPDYCERQNIWISIPTYVDYLNDDAIHEGTTNDPRQTPIRTWNSYSIDPPFDNTKSLQETFTFVVNQPDIDYQYGFIDISFHGSMEAIFYFNAAQNGIVYFDSEVMESLGEDSGQLKDTPRTPGTMIMSATRLAAGPTDGPPEEIWSLFKDHLLKQQSFEIYSGQSIREMLYSTNIKHSWIDEFLKFYPELDT